MVLHGFFTSDDKNTGFLYGFHRIQKKDICQKILISKGSNSLNTELITEYSSLMGRFNEASYNLLFSLGLNSNPAIRFNKKIQEITTDFGLMHYNEWVLPYEKLQNSEEFDVFFTSYAASFEKFWDEKLPILRQQSTKRSN